MEKSVMTEMWLPVTAVAENVLKSILIFAWSQRINKRFLFALSVMKDVIIVMELDLSIV
jgi:neutral trehalase